GSGAPAVYRIARDSQRSPAEAPLARTPLLSESAEPMAITRCAPLMAASATGPARSSASLAGGSTKLRSPQLAAVADTSGLAAPLTTTARGCVHRVARAPAKPRLIG